MTNKEFLNLLEEKGCEHVLKNHISDLNYAQCIDFEKAVFANLTTEVEEKVISQLKKEYSL